MKDELKKATLHCSFCGKADKEVKNLIVGPDVFICNECVNLCLEVIVYKDMERELLKNPVSRQYFKDYIKKIEEKEKEKEDDKN